MIEVEKDLEYVKNFATKFSFDNNTWQKELEKMLAFQDADGSFKLFTHNRIPSDARVDFCFWPTYYMAGVMMDVLLSHKYSHEEELKAALANALYYSTHRELEGHGYEGFSSLLDVMEYFISKGLVTFLNEHHSLSVAFNNMITHIIKRLKITYKKSKLSKNHYDRIKAILNKFLQFPDKVFVYGTLMKEEARSHIMNNTRYIGNATLQQAEMYDLGTYPGIKRGKGIILGEVYTVSSDLLQELDLIEGEGQLYERRKVEVCLHTGASLSCWAYFYKDAEHLIKHQKLGVQLYSYRSTEDLVWYVSYGSNMLFERFNVYLSGQNSPRYKFGSYEVASPSMPYATEYIKIPYDLYYAKTSSKWEGKGVAFLDDSSKKRGTRAKAYLITKSQFETVQLLEGAWYKRQIKLDDIYGIPAVTFTSPYKYENNHPSSKYLSTINEGLREYYDTSELKPYTIFYFS